MAREPEQDEAEPKDARYPYHPIASAVRIAQAVEELGGGRAGISLGLLASHLNKEESQGFIQLVSSARAYRMIQGRNKALTLTDQGHRLCRPESDQERRQAMISCFESPLAFRVLIERFDGQRLPSAEAMANILVRGKHAPDSWASRVAAFFVGGAKEVGVMSPDGILRVAASKHARAYHAVATNLARREQSPPPAEPAEHTFSGPVRVVSADSQLQLEQAVTVTKVTTWALSDPHGTIRVETPNPLSRALWERLKRYVESQEPLEEGEVQ